MPTSPAQKRGLRHPEGLHGIHRHSTQESNGCRHGCRYCRYSGGMVLFDTLKADSLRTDIRTEIDPRERRLRVRVY